MIKEWLFKWRWGFLRSRRFSKVKIKISVDFLWSWGKIFRYWSLFEDHGGAFLIMIRPNFLKDQG